MRKRLSDKERLGFMLDNIDELQTAFAKISYEDYTKDILIKHGITKLLQNICETSIYITDETKLNYPAIEWRMMRTMRNVLIHEYFGIDFQVVWDTAVNAIPKLKIEILKILAESFGE